MAYSKMSKRPRAAGGMGRNLIPTENLGLEKAARFLLPEPLSVSYGAISLPHPEKIADGGPKAVNRRSIGWGGEDAYFCASGRCFPKANFPCVMAALQLEERGAEFRICIWC